MATYTTYEQVGIKEDVSDVISNISPTKTPFQSSIGNEKVTQPLFQWQEDSLRAVAVNAKAEGADAVDVTAVPTVMRNNRTQILTETVKVAGTADAVSAYGRAKETAYQLAKSSAQVKRDLENAFVGTAQTKATGDDTTPTARQMSGYQQQIDTGGLNIVYTGAGPAALDEPHMLTALQNAYTAGADPNTIMLTPSNSLIVAAFAKAAGRYRTIQDNSPKNTTVVNSVDLYVSPFGEQRVKLNRFLKAGNTLIFEPSQWAQCTLRPWTREVLAKTGDATKNMIVGEFSLKHKNFKASSIVVEGSTGF
jgi:hypothetical protein